MKVHRLDLPGCLLLVPHLVRDERGYLAKPFVLSEYRALNLETQFAEEFYSRSRRGVLRGLHFQKPPHAHAKMVSCIYGRIRDVILDLRLGSPGYGCSQVIDLNARDGRVLYLPPGIAHGFLAQSEAVVWYHVTSPYVPSHDAGIRWDSVAVKWGCRSPIVSRRDQALPPLASFRSPFTYRPEESNP